MLLPELKRLIEQMGKDRGINKEIITDALRSGNATAASKNLDRTLILKLITTMKREKLKFFNSKPLSIKSLILERKSPRRSEKKS